ncbi:MAG: efflux RND transporter permease subunit [Candidatus Peribacteria bacterium]|nr:MAG: efflux RND transporter permease subunit [Candidatus Peribacteria bacterium]
MIALAGIVVGNAILLLEYVMILLNNGNTVKMALVTAGWIRMKPILITSLTTIL